MHDCTFNGINYEIYWNLNINGFALRITFHCKHPQPKTTNQFCEMNKKPIIGLFWFGNLMTNFIINVWFYTISSLKTLICNLNMEPLLTWFKPYLIYISKSTLLTDMLLSSNDLTKQTISLKPIIIFSLF